LPRKTCGTISYERNCIKYRSNIRYKFQTTRPPVVGVKLGLIAKEGRNNEE